MKLPLDLCANGCGVPPCPPSLVICRACTDKITKTLEDMIARMEARKKKEKRAKEVTP